MKYSFNSSDNELDPCRNHDSYKDWQPLASNSLPFIQNNIGQTSMQEVVTVVVGGAASFIKKKIKTKS
ncbi:unnamed protein product [Gordionus sp. m RMFG-2023]